MPGGMKFNPPPGWPTPSEGWVPTSDWRPDPSWPPAPPDWVFWVPDDSTANPAITADDDMSAVRIEPTTSPGATPDPQPPDQSSPPTGGRHLAEPSSQFHETSPSTPS